VWPTYAEGSQLFGERSERERAAAGGAAGVPDRMLEDGGMTHLVDLAHFVEDIQSDQAHQEQNRVSACVCVCVCCV